MNQTTANSLADLTDAEVQILDGAVVTTTELNTVCDGGTSATSTTLVGSRSFLFAMTMAQWYRLLYLILLPS
ncbi:MAG: hypothetical protein CM15mV110_020 [Caudoviricetes sp.]|nr:MAG: hypothetical protein CM15mV110_020 [Caudoviricetes sp.]